MAFDSIRIEKGMYHVPGKTFTQVLEELDPSRNYIGTEYEGLDAFQRQLKRFNIKVAGADSDALEKFYSTADSSALFPEYVTRAIKTGIDETDLLPNVIASTTRIHGQDYRSVVSNPSDSAKELRSVAEGTAIPTTAVATKENLVHLTKRGRMLVASYEALKYQRLDLFTVMLRQIGAHIAKQQFADAMDTVINGDGNDNAAVEIQTAAIDVLTYDDLLAMWNALDPYELNTIIASPAMMLKMLAIEEFKNPQTGINFQGTGRLNSPLGANFIKSDALGAGVMVGLDKRFALEMVIASDVTVEYDKLIDQQLERAAISVTAGFSKIFEEASVVMTLQV
ncbi:MAG: phage major capsid protein [Clostridia bacterium]|nr:phage major capsid protein [Clostridia bacterium]